ncbi:MAG: right-handed parallel beta-helix repeat-containing protein [Luteolibacter sp.]
MTFNDARKVLGLGPDEDPRPHLAEFRIVREKIARMVREAPNENLALRYQEGLLEFDRALAACREYLEALGLSAHIPAPATREDVVVSEPQPADPDTVAETRSGRGSLSWIAWLLVFLTGAAVGGWLYFEQERESERQTAESMAFLERQATVLIESRRWEDARGVFAEIERLAPGSEVARDGLATIDAGIKEEESQFIAYWTGQAATELEAGRLDEADAAVRRVLEKHPAETEAAQLRERIAQARGNLAIQRELDAVRRLIQEEQWEPAILTARRILAEDPSRSDARELLATATKAQEKQSADLARAGELFRMAEERDHGQFDQQALDWLREAVVLAPGDAKIAALLEKMSSYTRTLRVPGDFATPAEALAAARHRDRIVLGARSWKGPLVLNVAVDIEGAGPEVTIVECPPGEGSPIAIGPEARGARISGITFRHQTFLADGRERFAAAVVRGGGGTFVDCHFIEASGHGLVVIDGGELVASRCRFSGNGWNGAAAIGAGSRLEVRDSQAVENFGHGIESWDGASVTLVNNRCEGNSGNGIHADNLRAAAVIEGNQLTANREYGLVLTSAGSGKAFLNTARANLLGGFVVRRAAAAVAFEGNEARDNQGPGLVTERGLSDSDYATVRLQGNRPAQSLLGVSFPGTDAGNARVDE